MLHLQVVMSALFQAGSIEGGREVGCEHDANSGSMIKGKFSTVKLLTYQSLCCGGAMCAGHCLHKPLRDGAIRSSVGLKCRLPLRMGVCCCERTNCNQEISPRITTTLGAQHWPVVSRLGI